LVFVTPPLADWTLAVSTALFPPDRAEVFVKPLLERLSRRFRDVQYFCTHRDVELSVWGRAKQGRLVRGYGWLGEKGLTLWNEGTPTKEERDLGFRFSDGQSPTGTQGPSVNVTSAALLRGMQSAPTRPVDPDPNKIVTLPNESGVMQLACLWSIDPTTLNEEFKEPLMGLLGKLL
jgi:hypothetical protein